MNIAVLSYSFTGNNEALAKSVAKELSAKHIRISTLKPFKMGTLLMDMIFARVPKVQPFTDILQQYDLVLFFGPVWISQVASPLRAYLNYLKQNPMPYGFLSISGGADGGNHKLSDELLRRTGKQPEILFDQNIAVLFPPSAQVTRKDTSFYRVNDADIKQLTNHAVERINKIL